ncbi:11642_t:CDS:1, partial [Racocetra persica]
ISIQTDSFKNDMLFNYDSLLEQIEDMNIDDNKHNNKYLEDDEYKNE